jgi:hypothetical protein
MGPFINNCDGETGLSQVQVMSQVPAKHCTMNASGELEAALQNDGKKVQKSTAPTRTI